MSTPQARTRQAARPRAPSAPQGSPAPTPRPTHTRRAAAASTGLWGYGCCGLVSPLFFAKHVQSVLLLENVKLHDVAFKPCINKILHYII